MSEHVRPSSVKPRDSRSSVSCQELTEEFDHTLPEKRVMFDNDWNYIEKFIEDELSSSSCSLLTLPLSPQVTESHNSEFWMSSGNTEDPENSVYDSITLTPATKKEVLKTWEFVDGLLRESLRSDRDSENSVSSEKFNAEINSTLQEEFENKNWTNGDNMEDLLRKNQLLPPPLLTPYTSPVWLAPPQSHTNTVLTQGGVQEHMFMLPLPTFTHHAPLHAHPPFIRAPLEVTSNTNAPFSLGAQHDHVFRPPPPRFTHHAPPFPLVLPAVQQMIIRPPALPAGGADSQELNLHSLSISCLPPDEGICCLPIGFLNEETLYNAVHAPLNVNTSNMFTHSSLLFADNRHNRRVRDRRDEGRPYVKKPPNAFMLFLKEIRPKVMSELNTNKSAMVNTVVGEMWKSLPAEVKARYFEKARLEQKLHEQQHPGWSTGQEEEEGEK
ncbi:transcription factor 7-like 1 [Poecilia reticulata]|uniref:transcription factor 7-like 1 n=1 Tax=Poecilia reticulata TaxID=8081 RepID=UPI0004A2E46D|nr:PREDICTED: transcription factor 7-like 1 [Poecilia reticulata]